ncbi:S-layer homology domain-containing protein [Paenibacillus andongensis]|uniref:S-layer homology domain-containing protein n=1 Tax=Paenibacillus andongensis TaxID=2975482 RepID=UPI0021BA7E2F|nr:S-layer homology domain-containing protein [Paenibacillus andongensis]
MIRYKNLSKQVLALVLMGYMISPNQSNAESNALSNINASKITDPNVTEFLDLKGHWGESVITAAVDKGYVDGYPDGTFKPNGDITRAEFIKMVDNALHVSVAGKKIGDSWYVPYINAAVTSGFHQWSDFSSGDWNTALTRQEMARIAVRAATGDKNTDDNKWMYLATKAGLIMGMDDTGILGVDNTTTRAQSVTIIERVLSVKNGTKLKVDKHAVSRAEVHWHGTNVFTMWPRYFPQNFIDNFDITQANWKSSDGNYHEYGEEFIVVDMEDPNDPYRNGVVDMKFNFATYDSSGKRTNLQIMQAPSKSYVSYSRVKVVIQNDIDAGPGLITGGYMNMTSLGMDKDSKIWDKVLSSQEDDNTVLYSKSQGSQNTFDLNTSNGNWSPQIPRSGSYILRSGTHYWVQGRVHPKGDAFLFFSGGYYNSSISFTPSARLYSTDSPNNGSHSFIVVNAHEDYETHN